MSYDDERVPDVIVELDDELPVLPEQTGDDTDRGWGEWTAVNNDDRLLEERPPHWD